MTEEFQQGCIDNSYIQLAPNVGGLVELSGRIDRAANTMPWSYLNAELRPMDPFAVARAHVAGRPIEPYSRYLPRRDIVERPLPSVRP